MPYTTLISPAELAVRCEPLSQLAGPDWVVVDCRYDLKDPAHGQRSYHAGHIPSAVYAHLDRDLSAAVVPGVTGRHPLPSVEAAAQVFGRMGITSGTQVVAYDDLGGALAAARLWWMLRWLGHTAVAVLDGGWQAWSAEPAFPVETGAPASSRPASVFIPHPQPQMVATSAEVEQLRQDPAWLVLDSRAADRYRGENETIDPVAGHIPGAISCPYSVNLGLSGAFLPALDLRARFKQLLESVPAEQAVFYCGSGATAAHNILAAAHAGLGMARLYAGSWSEWITQPGRPVAISAERG